MTCCEGWTSCNGFSLLALLLLGIVFNAIPLVVNRVENGQSFQNPISCFEWWFPGIIGAGLMAVPATVMSLGARKRACCNNKTGMFFSSLLNVITVIGAAYCVLVSLQAFMQGPLICNDPGNGTASCEFSKDSFRIHPESFNLQWFLSDSCVPPTSSTPTVNDTMPHNRRTFGLHFSSKTDKHKTIHFVVFLGLLLVGSLEFLFGLSQIIIGFLGCLCGVSKRPRGLIV
ncbi:PREDICTED: transmembrane 4 L6 family member 20 [Miniopterus natalensis]|uniref:transmembrane 4 L6 family member 20 n=1 Tax=Miniopterus natalensis TaxID=291302 RepID=UPI0007A6AC43|nr:PREDICTED: transmembrane 4 L6 family member 20 [Miniopterus natalensis]